MYYYFTFFLKGITSLKLVDLASSSNPTISIFFLPKLRCHFYLVLDPFCCHFYSWYRSILLSIDNNNINLVQMRFCFRFWFTTTDLNTVVVQNLIPQVRDEFVDTKHDTFLQNTIPHFEFITHSQSSHLFIIITHHNNKLFIIMYS